MNTNLSLSIPTFNRAQFLDYSLSIHIPIARQFDVAIYISDNNSTDDTFEIVQKWMKVYDYLFYSKNESNLGPDMNFKLALKLPETNFVWLIGDTAKIPQKVFESAVEQSNEKYDLIILNESSRITNFNSQIINDKNILLSKLGWHLTQISCAICSKELIHNTNFSNYVDTRFIHVGFIFEFLSSKNKCFAKWNQDLEIGILKIKNVQKNSWQEDTFDIWLRKWPNFVLSLPSVYPLKSKIKMIQLHNNSTSIFKFKSLLVLRSEGFYSLKHYFTYFKYFRTGLGRFSNIKFLFIAFLPSSFVKFLIKLFYKHSRSN